MYVDEHVLLVSKQGFITSDSQPSRKNRDGVNSMEYTENTTIHGIKYLGIRGSIIEKLYWLLIFILCSVCLGLFIREILSKWNEKNVILVENETPTLVYKIPFPAVTICPQVKLKKSEFSYKEFIKVYYNRFNNESAYNDIKMKYDLAQLVCHPTARDIFQLSEFSGYLNSSHIEMLHRTSPTLYETTQFAEIADSCSLNFKNLSNFTQPFPRSREGLNASYILTNEGVCFTYNLKHDILRRENIQSDYPYHNISSQLKYNITLPRFGCFAGDISSFKLFLTSDSNNFKSICHLTELGYKIVLHPPTEYPTTLEHYIPVNHESFLKIKVEPKMISTSEGLRSYSPKQRQCYFNDERDLKFYQFYNRINCKLECFTNFTLKYYGCVHFAFPRSPGDRICGDRQNILLHAYEIVDNLDALSNYLNNNVTGLKDNIDFGEGFGDLEFNSCDCLAECNSIEYKYTTETESFHVSNIIAELDDNGSAKSNTGDAAKFIPARLEIFWKNPQFIGSTRKQLYTFSDLVSNFGGLVGLFMGASILSIFEIIYFCVVRRLVRYCKC